MIMLVITNNPLVRDRCPEAEFHDTDYLGVLVLARDKIHLGHRLLTHPLSGSVKPGETPYKTVVISAERSSLDEKALNIIEESIQTSKKLLANRPPRSLNEEVMADFRLIDYDLIFNENSRLPPTDSSCSS